MNLNLTGAAALCLVLACGGATGADTPSGPSGNAHDDARKPGSQAGFVHRATLALRLQPGDAARIENAVPASFVSVRGYRDFSGELIVRAKPARLTSAADRISGLMAKRSAYAPEFVVKVPAGLTEGELAAVLRATGDYESVEPNWVLYPASTTPNDPQFGSSWQHTRMQSALAWDITQGSSSVIVAICDSGVDTNHPDLQAALVPGYNAVNNTAQVDGGQVEDVNGHGTFVSGCAAAIGNNGVGVVGAGWNFGVMPIRVSNSSGGGANLFDLTEGARWAAAHGAKAINVSFTGATSSGNNSAALDVKQLGGLLFWASGNAGDFIGGPAPHLTVVGATTASDNRAGFSNYGTALDLGAPGSGVRSTENGGGYGTGSGTSFASPMATGVAAMIFAANPALSPDDVQDILYSSADDLGPDGWDQSFGWGRVNTFTAVTMAQTYQSPIPLPISESFDSASWTDLLTATAGSPGAEADPDAPSGAMALALDAGEGVESVPLAAMASNDDTIRLAARPEGVPAGAALTVEYLDNDGQWTVVYQAVSPGIDSPYVLHEEPAPAGFSHHGSALRLTAQGSTGRWFVDDLTIDDQTPVSAPFADAFDTGRVSVTRWADNSGASVVLDTNDFMMSMGNDATVTTVALPLIDLASFEQWVWFFVSGDGLGGGDALTVEYRAGPSGWTPLDIIALDDIGQTPVGVEMSVPFGAVAADNFQLRLIASTGGGTVLVDDVHIGLSRLPDDTPGCSSADFAEPYGTLNFFDVSAFLAAYNAADPSADLADPAGVFNFFDVSAFLASYNAGCP